MKKEMSSEIKIILVLLLISFNVAAQISYSGFIDKYPITLVIHSGYGSGIPAAYAYDKFDTPITVDGTLKKSRLQLFEKDNNKNIQATLRFNNFSEAAQKLQGEWINKDSTKRLKISLTRNFEIDAGTQKQWEILQYKSLPDHYFKLVVTKSSYGDLQVTGVKIFDKKTDRFIQQIDLECQYLGLDNIDVDDYNFDGLPDFSIFEASYAGANTTSVYILRSSASDQYFVSEITGTSLSFDPTSKRVLEHNECCAGSQYTDATYEIVDNRMKLLFKKCFEYNQDKQDYFEVSCD
jgi:hypothetical protein